MNVIERMLSILTGTGLSSKDELVRAEVCPNCWGKQEYANEYRDVIKQRSKNANEEKAFVEKFIETHLTGVKLKKENDKLICPTCAGVYKKANSNAN